MVSPGKLTALTALADGSTAEFDPSIDPDTGEVGYPEAERHLDDGDPTAFEVLESFARREILAKTFEEKVYICPGCGTEGMAYTTACPGCGSAHTVETELFEHLDCGCIAPRDRFEVGTDGFVCPECEARLDAEDDIERGRRHVCQDCDSYFETPEHGLRCRSCTDIYVPGETVEQVLCRYSLTDEGERWVETQLTARESMVETLAERGFDARADTTVRGESGAEHPVHVYAEDDLLDSRVVASIHERPDASDATALRDVATDIDARPVLITTLGSVDEQVATAADRTEMRILSARADGSLERDFEVTADDPRNRQSLVQRIASAVKQP